MATSTIKQSVFNTLGTAIDIQSYGSYQFTNDGFVKVAVKNGSSYFLFYLGGEQICIPQNASYNTVLMFYVKKGMVLNGKVNTSTSLSIVFLPLT